MTLDHERRHHQLLQDLAATIRISATMGREEPPIPDLGFFRADSDAILEVTGRLLEIEREDNKELKAIAKELRDF